MPISYYEFVAGKTTKKKVVEELITEVACSLYAYMIMLEDASRTEESKYMGELRNRIFQIRTNWNNDVPDQHIEMNIIHHELEVVRTYLYLYRPNESKIFQSPINDSGKLIHILKEYEE